MSATLTLARPGVERRFCKASLPCSDFERRPATLDEIVSGAWTELATGGLCACPICGGTIVADAARTGSSVGGCCRDCGTTLD